jgi:hypothetical protein
MHASAVMIDGNAALFLGASGRGKSTWAATLQRQGHHVLSDDCVLLSPKASSVVAMPTYPSLRLRPDVFEYFPLDGVVPGPMAQYSQKRRLPVPPRAASEEDPTVSALFLLEAASDTGSGIRRVSPRQSFIELTRNTFKLDPTDTQQAAELGSAIALIAGRVPAFALRSPPGLSALPEFVESVVAHLRHLAK